MRNGKGKSYDKGSLLFEGETIYGYLKKGKLYYEDGKVLYEGEFLFKKRWNGIEKKYDKNGKLLREVEYKYGKKFRYKYKII